MFKLNAFKASGRREGAVDERGGRGGARRVARAVAPVETAQAGEASGTGRGERTRELILGTALELFRERGYEETTMRAIAQRAGVSLGNAYYYFRSKEHLIQAFYAQSHREHLDASRPILEREKELAARLKGVLYAKLSTSEAYHRFSGILFKTAADPNSPLSPFSPESHP